MKLRGGCCWLAISPSIEMDGACWLPVAALNTFGSVVQQRFHFSKRKKDFVVHMSWVFLVSSFWFIHV
jgi:hypothetical protein